MPLTEFATTFSATQATAECQAVVDKNKRVSNRDLFLFIRNVIWLRGNDWFYTFRADFPLEANGNSGIIHLGYNPPESHPLNQDFLQAFDQAFPEAGENSGFGHSYYDTVSVQFHKADDKWEHFGINRYKSAQGKDRFICHILVVDELYSSLAGDNLYGLDRQVPVQLFPHQGLFIAQTIWRNHLDYPDNLPLDSFGEPLNVFVHNSDVNPANIPKN